MVHISFLLGVGLVLRRYTLRKPQVRIPRGSSFIKANAAIATLGPPIVTHVSSRIHVIVCSELVARLEVDIPVDLLDRSKFGRSLRVANL